MFIPLLDGAVAVVYSLVAGPATTLRPIDGAATAIGVRTAGLRWRPLRRLFHSGGHDPAPLSPASDERPRTDLDQAAGAVR
jgi:hypothetical protein